MWFVTLLWFYQIWESLPNCLLWLLLYAKLASKKKEIKRKKFCILSIFTHPDSRSHINHHTQVHYKLLFPLSPVT